MRFLKARWNQGVAGLLLILIAIIQKQRFGLKILNELDDGNFFFLGGPSLWYSTALIPTIVGIGYLIAWIISLGVVEISADNEVITLSERKGFIAQKLSLPKKDIFSVEISNTRIRWEVIGTIFLILSAYWLAIDAISLLTYHAIFGVGVDTGIYYLLQAIGNVVAVIIILFFEPAKIKIRSLTPDRVVFHFPLILDKIRNTGYYHALREDFGITPRRIIKGYRNQIVILILYGLVLVVVAITSRIFNVFSSEPLRILYIFIGLWCLTYGVKNLYPDGKKWFWNSAKNHSKSAISISKWSIWLITITIFCTILTLIYNLVYLPWNSQVTSLLLSNFGYGVIVIGLGILIIVTRISMNHKLRK